MNESSTENNSLSHEGVFDTVQTLGRGDLAIQKSFHVGLVVLKSLIVVVFISWIFSGFYKVENGEHAVELLLGKINPYDEKNVRTEGWYWGLPFPLTKVIKLPVKKELGIRVDVASEAMAQDVSVEDDPITKNARNYYVTKDKNLIHLGWDITFRIRFLDQFLLNFYEEGDINKGRGNDQPWVNHCRSSLFQLSRGIVLNEVARLDAMEILTGRNALNQMIQHKLQEALDGFHSGLEVTSLSIVQATPPASVRMAFVDVLTAKEKQKQKIAETYKEKESILLSIESEKKKIELTARNEAEELVQNIKADALRVQTLMVLYQNNAVGLKNYLHQLYDEVMSSAISHRQIEIIRRSKNTTFRTNIFIKQETGNTDRKAE